MAKENGEFKTVRLRQAVSAVVFKKDKFLMVSGKDWPAGAWCFPQGGILPGESHFQAVKRELTEELGTNKFEIIGKSTIDHMYLFPDNIRKKKGFEGQYQTIWFVKLIAEIENIRKRDGELMNLGWFNKKDVVLNMMYDEQKEVFKRVLEEFDKLKSS